MNKLEKAREILAEKYADRKYWQEHPSIFLGERLTSNEEQTEIEIEAFESFVKSIEEFEKFDADMNKKAEQDFINERNAETQHND